MEQVKKFLRGEEGVTAVEYGLIAAAIATVLIAAMAIFGPQLAATFTRIAGSLG